MRAFAFQGIRWLVCPGLVMLMLPPQMQMSFELLFSAGMPHTSTVGEPGIQGAGVAGTHGMGVKTPSAAAVAAATMGLDGLWHIPKGGMFMIGMLSMMLAASTLFVSTVFIVGMSELGAMPIEHCIIAFMQTCMPMVASAAFQVGLVQAAGAARVHTVSALKLS